LKLYIESALRIKGRLLICGLLVFGLGWAALYLSKAGDYSTWATVWVEKPLYLDTDLASNPYVNPSTIQTNILNELLTTRKFTLSIAQGAGIDMPTTAAEDEAVTSIQRHLLVEATGPHLVRITCTGDKTNHCKDIISNTVQLFIAELDAGQARQADVALQLYEQQRTTYEQEMNTSRDAYNQYIADHPTVATGNNVIDPDFAELQQQYLADKGRYDDVIAKIDSIRTQSSTATEANSSFFRVIDPASDAKPYVISNKDLIRNALVASVLALFAILAISLVSTWVDTSVHTLNDLNAVLLTGTELSSDMLVGVVPYIKDLADIRQRTDNKNKAKEKGSATDQHTGKGLGIYRHKQKGVTAVADSPAPKPLETNIARPTVPDSSPLDLAASAGTRQ
jgi:hypothetical protein